MHQPPINHRARNHYPIQASNATRSSNNYNRTGRAQYSSSSSWLDSLPLYDTTPWEGKSLLDRYGHNIHIEKRDLWDQGIPVSQPRFYLPPEDLGFTLPISHYPLPMLDLVIWVITW